MTTVLYEKLETTFQEAMSMNILMSLRTCICNVFPFHQEVRKTNNSKQK